MAEAQVLPGNLSQSRPGAERQSVLAVNKDGEAVCVVSSIEAMESGITRLEQELTQLRERLGEVRSLVRSATVVGASAAAQGDAGGGATGGQDAYDVIGDPNAKRMLREVEDTIRQQAEALGMMEQSVQAFPRRWSRFEVNTDRRKTLMLDLKSRREGRPSLLNEVAQGAGVQRGSLTRVSLQRADLG